jgi:glycosyltransferase involved in cell wall biosynthesis
MCEAAACGLPVVAPRNTAHAELLDDSTAFLFDPEGTAPWPGTQSVSPWYEGVHFSVLGERSRKQLAEQLRRARHDRAEAEARGGRFCDLVRSRYTWDRSAAHAVERLLEIAS